MNNIPSEAEIHAYIDGRLDDNRRQAVELYLASNPVHAEQIRGWQADSQQLRAAFGAWPELAGNPNLDPARIRQRRQNRLQRRWASAAMVLLALGIGAAGGWQAQQWQADRSTLPMSDAMAAYRLVTQGDGGIKLDIESRHNLALQKWLDQHFAHAAPLPDLDQAGYHPVGGRLFVTDQGLAATVLYQDLRGRVISFYLRPPGPQHHLLAKGQRSDGELLAQYGSDRSYNYAMVTRNDMHDQYIAAHALTQLI